MQKYGRVLIACMVTSFALLFVVPYFKHDAGLLPLLTAMLPLMGYHLVYLAPRVKKGLSGPALDSVYYYGFLLTLGTLGLSAMRVSQGAHIGEDTWRDVGFQFGAGLIATGYAVAARVHLLAIRAPALHSDQSSLAKQALERSVQLLTSIELATARFETFAHSLVERTEAAADRARQDAQETIRGSVHAFAEEMNACSGSIRQLMTDAHRVLGDESLLRRQKQLAEATALLTKVLGEVTPSIQALHGRGQEFATLTTTLLANGKALNHQIVNVHASLERVSGMHSELELVRKELTRLVASLHAVEGASDASVGALRSLAEPVERFGRSAAESAQHVATFGTRTADVTANTTKLDALLKTLGDATSSARALDVCVEKVASSLEPASSKLTELVDSAGKAAESIRGFSSAASSVEDGAEKMIGGIQSLQERVGQLTLLTNTLAQEGIKAATALRQIPEAAPAIRDLGANLEAVARATAGLVDAFVVMEQSLERPTTMLNRRIHAVSDGLARNLEDSGRAIDLLTKKLVDVAQIIIERTRRDAPR